MIRDYKLERLRSRLFSVGLAYILDRAVARFLVPYVGVVSSQCHFNYFNNSCFLRNRSVSWFVPVDWIQVLILCCCGITMKRSVRFRSAI